MARPDQVANSQSMVICVVVHMCVVMSRIRLPAFVLRYLL